MTSLGELIQAYEYESDVKINRIMKNIMATFPSNLIEIAKCFIDGINEENDEIKFLLINNNLRKPINEITTKELQDTLKKVLKKVEVTDFNTKLGVTNFEEDNISKLRRSCKNPKLRNIYFRLIHNDFYTHVKMFKYKMTETDKCPRCNQIETTKHLLWECIHVKNIWNCCNQIIQDESVNSYDDVFKVNDNNSTILIKIKIIQELIQIERPKNWNTQSITEIIYQLMNTEKYNAIIAKNIVKHNNKWIKYQNLENRNP
jgi:hypothetical protein